MFCTRCGNQVPDGASFCTRCGNQINSPAQNQAPVYPSEQYVQPTQPAYPSEQYVQPTQSAYPSEQYTQPNQAYAQNTYAYNQNDYASPNQEYSYNQQSQAYDPYQYTGSTPVATPNRSKKWMIPVFVSIGATLMIGLVFLILFLTCTFGHDYERDYSSNATCHYTYKCSRCHSTKTRIGESGNYAVHNFSSRSCSLCGISAKEYLGDIVYNEGYYNSSYDAYYDYTSFSYDGESYYIYFLYDSYYESTTILLEDSTGITLELEIDTVYSSYDWRLENDYYYMYGSIPPSSFTSYTSSLSYDYTNSSYSSTYAQYSALMLEAMCYGVNYYMNYEGYELDAADLGFTSLSFY